MTQTTFSDKVLVQGSQDTPQLQVEANATQTQPLQNWLDSSNNVKVQVTGDGRVQIGNNLGVGAPADSLLQLNQDVTLPSSLPTSGTHTLGRLTGALSSAVSWVVHELQLLGTGGVSGLQTAVRAKLTLSNTGTSTSAELRAGDFQTINQGGASGSAVGQATGLRATASNSASAYLAKAVGVEAALTNDTGGNLTQATAFNVVSPTNTGTIGTLYGLQIPDLTQGSTNYAIYTGRGSVHLGDMLSVAGKVGIGTTTPGQLLDLTYGHLRFTPLAAPAAPTVAVSATAGVLNGNYSYKITFVTASGETSLSAASSTLSPASKQVNITLPLGPTGTVTQRKIYRTKAGGSIYFYVVTVADNTTTLYADNISDSSLTANNSYRDNTTAAQFYVGTTLAAFLGDSNLAFGKNSLTSSVGPNNTAQGNYALYSNTTGNDNTAQGTNVLYFNTTGTYNTAQGSSALYNNTTGSYNVAQGYIALQSNTTGSGNTAQGHGALQANTTGQYNTSVGEWSLPANTSGIYNTAFGNFALYYNTIGNSNTALGPDALFANTNGSNNTAVGENAGVTDTYANANTTGYNNTFIGYNSGPGTSTQLTNATALGYNALVSANNALVLGGIGANAVSVGIGVTTPNSVLQVAGPIATAVASKTASYTITATDSLILADTTSASVTITLPTAVGCTGRRYTIKRISAGANSCTINTTSSQTIDGAATKSLASQWTILNVVSNGTNWLTV